MASASALSTTSALVNRRAAAPRLLAPAPQCVGLPPLAPPPQTRAQRAGAYCRKIVRNVAAVAGGESMTATIAAPQESAAPTAVNGEATAGVYITETPEFVKTIQEAWDKVEDKYAVSTLAFAGAVTLWGTAGMISAIDRLPLVPGALEVVGIGYTGWFAYKNLFFKPDRIKRPGRFFYKARVTMASTSCCFLITVALLKLILVNGRLLLHGMAVWVIHAFA